MTKQTKDHQNKILSSKTRLFNKNVIDYNKFWKGNVNSKLLEQLSQLNLHIDQMPKDLHQWQQFLAQIDSTYSEYENQLNTVNLIQAKAVQTSKLAVLGELAAGVAHEINNPLMILTSIAFVLQKHLEQNRYDQLPEKLEKIQTTIARIGRIVNGLRTYARDGENDPMMPVNLKDVIIESLELCIESIRYQNIDITFEDRIDEDAIIQCRDTQISQVLLNLISNAKDAVLPLEEKWIKIILQKKNQNVILQVIDSGRGIPNEIIKKIFQPFFTTKNVGSGTGLGLSISSEIIKNHNGQLYINSEGPNTCFTIELPIVK